MNKKFKCVTTTSNMITEPSHKSELLTQVLLNDRVELVDEGDKVWMKVKNKFNGTEGWVLKAQYDEINQTTYIQKPVSIVAAKQKSLNYNSIPSGSFVFEGELVSPDLEIIPLEEILRNDETIRSILFSFIDTPYVWGGVTHAGIDCSGLSQILYRFFGIALTSFAAEQFHEGEVLDFLQNASCGDLAFFENETGIISHVGILLSPSEIIHATETAGKVVIDAIDQEGIISKKTGKRTHQLRVVKRL